MQPRTLIAASTLLVASSAAGFTVAHGAAAHTVHHKTVKAVTVNSDTGQYGFVKKTIKIHVNTRVTWINSSDTGHNITAISSNWHIVKDLEVGATVSHTFKKSGTYTYQCTIHPGMTGKIIVIK